jgi:hypothetical protein
MLLCLLFYNAVALGEQPRTVEPRNVSVLRQRVVVVLTLFWVVAIELIGGHVVSCSIAEHLLQRLQTGKADDSRAQYAKFQSGTTE